MARKLSVGDKVLCRYFNQPTGKFYGDTFTGTITNIHSSKFDSRDFTIKRDDMDYIVTVWRKEIKRRIS